MLVRVILFGPKLALTGMIVNLISDRNALDHASAAWRILVLVVWIVTNLCIGDRNEDWLVFHVESRISL